MVAALVAFMGYGVGLTQSSHAVVSACACSRRRRTSLVPPIPVRPPMPRSSTRSRRRSSPCAWRSARRWCQPSCRTAGRSLRAVLRPRGPRFPGAAPAAADAAPVGTRLGRDHHAGRLHPDEQPRDRRRGRMRVELTDNRTFEAKVVGTDPPSDLAVLKIEAQTCRRCRSAIPTACASATSCSRSATRWASARR